MSDSGAVIFDLDGTLTKPVLDFEQIREEIGVKGPILEAMAAMSTDERSRASLILERHERKAAQSAELQDGALRAIDDLRHAGKPVAVLSRNSRDSVETVLHRFRIVVDAVRSRDDGAIKPAPDPILSICTELAVDPTQSWMVGDYLFDIESGRAAGATTILLLNGDDACDYADQADHRIYHLSEVAPLVGLSGQQH